MNGLGDKNNHNILINKSSYTRGFTKDELNLLNDLLTFNYKYEEAFFNNKIDEDILEMIDSIIEEKLKSISPDLAFRFLRRIWTLYSEGKTTLDAKIINGVDFDLTVNRLSIQLLEKVTNDNELIYDLIAGGDGLHNYLAYNFYNSFCDLGLKANKMLTLDHVEIFLALLNESTEIEQDLIDEITSIYLFLYKDIYHEILKNNLVKNSAVILSQRFNGYERRIMNCHTDIREENFSIQFAFEAMSMLSYKDKNLTEEDIEYLKVGKIYLDSLLMPLKEYELDRVLSYYNANEVNVDTRECTRALSYVKKSINEKDEQLKRNS